MKRSSEPAAWRLDIDDLARRDAPGLHAPDVVRFSPDGGSVTYLDGPGLVRSLWRMDLGTGERRRLAGPRTEASEPSDRAEELRRERTRTYALGVTRYAWSGPPDRPVLLVPVDQEWLVGVGTDSEPLPLPSLHGASEAILSPDGRRIAFVRDGDVWFVTDGEEEPRRITRDAEPGVMNGVAEYVAAEELKRFDGMWWSADGTQLAIARVDERHVEQVVLPHLGSSAEIERHRYPRAGGRNAEVRLRLADVEDGLLREVELPMSADDYLARVVPLPDRGFLVAVLPRAQDELYWLRVTPDGGVMPGWTEPGGAWVNLDDDTHPLHDGRIVRTTERSGFRHLEIREPDGGVRQLTEGPWVVTRVVGVAEARGEAIVIGTRDGVTERHVYAVPLAGGAIERLSVEPGWHEASLAPDGSRWADTWSSLQHSAAVVVRERESGRVVREVHPPTVEAAAAGLRPPDLLELVAADGTTPMHAAFYPANSAETPPLVVSTYGGPHSQKVMDAWPLTVDLPAQLLAQHGIAVLVVDNRGTFNRGVAFEAPLHRRLGVVEVEDTAAAVRQLAARGMIDPKRVGIMGWSYGGYMVLRAMLAEPDLFAVGVAGAPVVDWTLYDTAYTERYLGQPAEEPETYTAAGVVGRAGALRGSLLVIHGVIDENVHLRHTVRLVTALNGHGRAHEVVLLPGERHGVRDTGALRHRFMRTIGHLEEGLRPSGRPSGER